MATKVAPQVPKTPTRGRKAKAREPLTPSLSKALNNLNLRSVSPIKQVAKIGPDVSINPFLEHQVPIGQSLRNNALFSGGGSGKSRPSSRPGSRAGSRPGSRPGSPTKRSRSASRSRTKNVVTICGVEQRLDIVQMDYPAKALSNSQKTAEEVAPKAPNGKRPKRTKSCSSLRSQPDRFIMQPDPEAIPLASSPFHTSRENSPAHIQRLAEAVGINPAARILTFRQAPPPAQDPSLNAQRIYVQPLYAREKAAAGGAGGSSGGGMGTSGPKQRRLPTQPERVLDAPGMVDDYYLNLLAWSSRNVLAVALAENTYVWNAQTGSVTQLAEASEGNYVCSLDWAGDGAYVAIGLSNGDVELWDVEASRRLRVMGGHQARVPSLSWNGHILSSGCQDGSIWHHDVRVAQHKVGVLQGHSGEVCGLAWRSDGDCIASGGNDNVVNIWDGRVGDVTTNGRSVPKFTKRNHTAAVKALAWCPWQTSLLATGGGTGDATVHFWNSNTGARLNSLTTPAQVTSIQFTPLAKELFTSHGFPNNSIMVHSYPSLNKIGEIRDAHDSRVLYSALSPQGDVVVSGAGDENVKFWRIWEVPPKQPKSSRKGASSILTIR